MMNKLKTLLGKLDTLTVVIVSIAFVVCGIAWMRFFWVSATNPSPPRYVEYTTTQGPHDPFRQDCAPGPAFIEGDQVWRFCEYDDSDTLDTAAQWGLVRFDLAAGEADMLWPLPEAPDHQILALAKAPSGVMAVAWGAASDALTAVYAVDPAGGVEQLAALPADIPGRVTGLAWTSRGLELVTGEHGPVIVTTYSGDAWSAPRAVERPAGCDDDMLCKLQMAHLDADVWYFLYARAPRQVSDPVASTPVELLRGPDGGPFDAVAVEPLLTLADLQPRQYTLNDQRALVRLGDLFDRSPGNAVNWALDAEPFLLHGGTWERVAAPEQNAGFYFSNYAIGSSGGLRWIPGLSGQAGRYWKLDEWLTLKSSGEGVAVLEVDNGTRHTLANATVFLEDAGSQTSLLPASDGGYWLLGPYGTYVKASESLERADRLGIITRVRRAFESFGRLEPYQGDSAFYREQKLLKMAALPLVLLSLPAGYLLVFFVAQARKNTRAWITLLVRVSAVYVVVATVFIWWFWELMERF